MMPNHRTASIAGVLLAGLCLAACGDPAPAQPNLLDDLVGTWRGHHVDQTNDISESVVVVVTRVDEITAEMSVDFGARGRGPDPEPDIFTVTVEGSTATWSAFSPVTGDATVTIDEEGTVVASSGGLGLEFAIDGTLDAPGGRLEVFSFVTRDGSFVWQGRAVLCRDGAGASCEPTEAIPVVTECAVVPVTPLAGESCTGAAECLPPEGACVVGQCLQVCVPGECEDLCMGGETCFSVERDGAPVFFSDDRPVGGCAADDRGPGQSYARCGGGASLCQAELRCFKPGGVGLGACALPCQEDADCPAGPAGEVAGCDLYDDATNRRFCGVRCSASAAGTSSCPGELQCLASPSGGTCL